MFKLNETKDWLYNFSKAGKDATKFNKVLSDTIRNSKSKQNKKIYVNPCPEIAAFENLEKKKEEMDKLMNDDFDIFEKPVEEKEEKEESREKTVDEKVTNKEKYKYHDQHMKNLKKKEEHVNPSCTKYNPKYESIRRNTSIPSWGKQVGRRPLQKRDICDKFYLEHDNIMDTMAGNAFIDMSKQPVKRSIYDFQEKEKDKDKILLYENNNYSIINLNNTNNIELNINENSKRSAFNKEMTKSSSRFSNKKLNETNDLSNNKYISLNNNNSASSRMNSANRRILKRIFDKKNKKEKSFMNISNVSEIKPDVDFNENINANDISNSINTVSLTRTKSKKLIKSTVNNFQINSSNTILSSHNNSIELLNTYYKKRMSSKRPKNAHLNPKLKKEKSKSLIKAPDFSKSLSRETTKKIKDQSETVIPYLIPNYTQVRERPIMMVSYNKRKKVKNINTIASKIKGINYSFYFDADKCYDKINNHSTVHVPDFRLMSSRPIDDGPLPSYMKKIIDRTGICEYSLIMNNYKNRDFGNIHTTIFPKKSFNKVINLNLLRSKKFFGNIIFGECRKKIKKTSPLMEKIIRFYSKNYERILKEKDLDKFDSVTYKKYDDSKLKKN